MATALGVSERAGQSGADVLVRAIGDTRRLLIMDNCEHLRSRVPGSPHPC
nr:hypothetical protein [Streptomyces sp. TLI_235]